MKFKVFAGNMYCGLLVVYAKRLHIFKTPAGRLEHPEKLFNYRSLTLVREV